MSEDECLLRNSKNMPIDKFTVSLRLYKFSLTLYETKGRPLKVTSFWISLLGKAYPVYICTSDSRFQEKSQVVTLFKDLLIHACLSNRNEK